MNSTIPENMLPLTPVKFHILVALASSDKHGYGIMKEVEAITESRVKISVGTLYGAIKRLLEAELIEESDKRPEDDDERRRYYRLTGLGKRVCAAEIERRDNEVRLAKARAKPILGEAMTTFSIGGA